VALRLWLGFPKSRSLWENDFRRKVESELRKLGVKGDIVWR